MTSRSDLDEIKESGGYLDVKRLPDGSIAGIGELMFTRAIYLGMDRIGWSRRFCFEDRDRAVIEFNKLKSKDDLPQGWIARRPPQPEDYKDWP